ncbi:hypothetical protein RRG08_037355 [Elysia crispata]|uniref:Uncharacterized protein n=1 Tax=Elysia crispata TaxID=231223 RepID=A0AAE1DVI8_9GAST|nr:hypothetical protein RRG08_037355 [Elysia crispata]
MKAWVLLGFFQILVVAADDYYNVECRSSWCGASLVYRHKINGKDVCCIHHLHSYMVVRTERQRNKDVEKCYCKVAFSNKIG